jgi:uncharacterized membrane protein YbhN (UPF0104 family)
MNGPDEFTIGMRMLSAVSGFARSINAKIGWSRIGVALSVAVIVAAVFTLFRLLRDIDFDRVLAIMQATPLRTILLASVFVLAGYVTLTFYDYFALRTIGRRKVPYRTAAFASFTSYSIGHNLGAMVFTGGAVRLRIYSAWGLGIVEVAKIAFVTGLTFWLGNAFVLGAALAYAPEAASAVTQMPPWANRAIGLVSLASIVGYCMWLLPRPRVIGRDGWQVRLPDARLTFVQIGIGILDLGAGALAIYTLLPSEPYVDFFAVLVIFVAAALLGFISHAPGSLGVFDAAMLIALPQYAKEELLASLLIFRVLYFILPFGIAVVSLAIREVWFGSKSA